jgi:acetyltransferase EpsM
MKVLLYCAGGHAQVVADCILEMQQGGADISLAGFLDDNPSLIGSSILGHRILGPISSAHAFPHDAAFIAVGNNRMRAALFEKALKMEEVLTSIIHPSAVIARNVMIGRGTVIMPGVVVNTGTLIGSNVIINTSASVDHQCVLSDHVHLAPGVHLAGTVKIGEGALLGIGVSVVQNITIGPWATAGAGAVLINDVQNDDVVVGTPAKPITRRPTAPSEQ